MGDRLPYISVVMTTHNRTRVACAVIDSLVKNLKYPRINWIISDDRSDKGHVEKLVEQFKKNHIANVKICKTDGKRYGLGSSMNNGLKEAFKISPIVLTTEDDWILEKELHLAYFVDLINRNEDIATIRLATLNYAESRQSKYNLLNEVYSYNNIKNSVFNNQVALRHKRVYDKIGYYRENVNSDISEQDIIKKFNSQNQLKVYFPDFIKTNTMDDPSMFFIHVGKSTVGHETYDVPSRYRYLYSLNLKPITVIITTHNRTNIACAVIDSLVKNLKYPNLKWCISDDNSRQGHIERLIKEFKLNGVKDVHIEKTTDTARGLGASLNNGIKYAMTNSDIFLTTEDDWYIEKELNLEKYIKYFQSGNVSSIRLGPLFEEKINKPWRIKCKRIDDHMLWLYSDVHTYDKFILSNTPSLKHRRIFDTIGFYKENTTPEIQEKDFSERFNKLTNYGTTSTNKVLYPTEFRHNSYDNGYVNHVGISTQGHKYKVYDDLFIQLNEYDRKNIDFDYSIKYYIHKNFGDNLNYELIKRLSGKNNIKCFDIKTNTKTTTLMCIGSILKHATKYDLVWGPGFISENDIPSKNISSKNILCIRGPLSRRILTNNGISCPETYCDPGVLLPYLFNIRKETVQGRIGIIPHVVEYEKFMKENKNLTDNFIVINLYDDPEKVLNQISTCEKTISSSLHGIIVSESMGIESGWCMFSDKVVGNGFKFKDYYLGSGRILNDIKLNDFRKTFSTNNLKFTKPGRFNIYGLINTCPIVELTNDEKERILKYYETVI